MIWDRVNGWGNRKLVGLFDILGVQINPATEEKQDEIIAAINNISISGVSMTILEITGGSVDDSNLDFTFASKPKLVVINNMPYRENHGWTWTAGTLTATLSGPVGTNGDIYGIS